MITLADYWKQRDKRFGSELTAEIHRNAEIMVQRANQLLNQFRAATGDREDRYVTSGWRPVVVNQGTPNAAPKSRHITGQAIDISDPESDLDQWCLANLDVLSRIGLWLEHPAATKSWCHVQIVPPKSGHRVFYP